MLSLRSQTPKGQRARASILSAAEGLLVTRGFHGTSMRDIAKEAGLPLATVVYHFERKERLYAAVLTEIAGELTHGLAEAQVADDVAVVLVRWSIHSPHRVVLLLRELLDNPSRVARASQFPLAPFLLRASELARAAGAPQPELAVLQVVGAVSYVVASRPTVDRIVGPARAKQLAAEYETEMLAFARRALHVAIAAAGAASPAYDVATEVAKQPASRATAKPPAGSSAAARPAGSSAAARPAGSSAVVRPAGSSAAVRPARARARKGVA